LDGPVGARAVLDAIWRQCDPDLPDEWAFLICELTSELQGVKLKNGAARSAGPALQAQLEKFLQELRDRQADALIAASAALRTYAETIEARHESA
jgi:hypothetical protein